MKCGFITLVFLSVLWSWRASAIQFEDAVFPELAVSGRALAMGNAFIAKTDDPASVFYNPAGLGTIRNTHFHLSNIHLEVNKGWLDSAAGGNAFKIFGTLSRAFSLDGIRKNLLPHRGKVAHSNFHILPNFTTRFFSVGYLYSIKKRATIGAASGAQFEYADRTDHGPYGAINLSLFGGILKVGATALLLNRTEAIGESDPEATINLESADKNKGTAFIVITGAKFTLPFKLLPTFAANMHNLMDQNFSASSGSAGAPATIKNSIDLGFSVTPQLGKTFRIHFETNYKDFTGEYAGVSSSRKLTFGMEMDFARTFFFRLGYGDGFGSFGLGLRTQKLVVDMTTYAVDTTSNEFRGKEDRRFSLTFSTGF